MGPTYVIRFWTIIFTLGKNLHVQSKLSSQPIEINSHSNQWPYSIPKQFFLYICTWIFGHLHNMASSHLIYTVFCDHFDLLMWYISHELASCNDQIDCGKQIHSGNDQSESVFHNLFDHHSWLDNLWGTSLLNACNYLTNLSSNRKP